VAQYSGTSVALMIPGFSLETAGEHLDDRRRPLARRIIASETNR